MTIDVVPHDKASVFGDECRLIGEMDWDRLHEVDLDFAVAAQRS